MGEEIAFENGRISDFQGLMTIESRIRNKLSCTADLLWWTVSTLQQHAESHCKHQGHC